jgi:hypothetical protein
MYSSLLSLSSMTNHVASLVYKGRGPYRGSGPLLPPSKNNFIPYGGYPCCQEGGIG